MILIISTCKEKLHELEFVKPIEDIVKKENMKFFTEHYKQVSEKTLKKANKMIICGTSLADNDFLKNTQKFSWLRDYKKPVLGICAGAHIMGILFKQQIKKDKQIGLKTIELKKEFLGVKGKREVYHLHQFKILPELFQKDNFYATLFHPEVRNKDIIVNFLNL